VRAVEKAFSTVMNHTKQFLFLLLLLCPNGLFGAEPQLDTLPAKTQPHLYRNLAIGNVVFGTGAYLYFAETWGAPNGRFHIKSELHDNVGMTDEVSHFFAGYKMTEGFAWLFRTLKVQPDKVNRLAAMQTLLILTLIEYPMDAYNPSQGMGLTDLAANYAGVGWGLLRQKHPNNFDMKFCVKRPPWDFEHKLLASDNAEFDNFIWWGVWKPKYVWTGIGYSSNHDHRDVEPEVYLGVGTTLFDLLHMISPKVADEIKSLDTYFISLRVRL
jgi:hypothetical protein